MIIWARNWVSSLCDSALKAVYQQQQEQSEEKFLLPETRRRTLRLAGKRKRTTDSSPKPIWEKKEEQAAASQGLSIETKQHRSVDRPAVAIIRRPWRKDFTTDHFHLRLSRCSTVKTEDKEGKKISIQRRGKRRRQYVQWHTGCKNDIKRLAGTVMYQQLYGSNSDRNWDSWLSFYFFLTAFCSLWHNWQFDNAELCKNLRTRTAGMSKTTHECDQPVDRPVPRSALRHYLVPLHVVLFITLKYRLMYAQ